MLLLQFHTRIGAVLIAINMLVAIALAHGSEILALNAQGGWAIELQALLFFTAIAIALFGPGRYAINNRWRQRVRITQRLGNRSGHR